MEPQHPPLDLPVEFVIKSTTNDTFNTKFPLGSTVAEVKQHLSRVYPGHPQPAQQTVWGICANVPTTSINTHVEYNHTQLISAGKVLKDEDVALHTVIKQVVWFFQTTSCDTFPFHYHHQQDYDPQVPYTLHLVIKAVEEPLSKRPASTPARASTPVHPTVPTATPEPSSFQPSTGQPSTSGTPHEHPTASMPVFPPFSPMDPNLLVATDPSLAATYTMYSAAFTAYQYATHTAAGNPLPEHLRLASMPLLMVCVGMGFCRGGCACHTE